MAAKLVSERRSPVLFSEGTGIDVEKGIARGVVVCGLRSANGRVYPADVLRKAVARYEGAQVYLDHKGARDGRGVREWFGELRNARSRPDGRPEADLHFDTANPFAAEFCNRAEKFPRSLGLSHVALCRSRYEQGEEVVESIVSVNSVDVVASPATSETLFESKGGKAVSSTLRKVLESSIARLAEARRRPANRAFVLLEDDAAMAPMMDAPVDEPPPEVDPDEAIDDAFKQAMHAQVDALLADSHTLAEFISKCRELYKSRAKIMGQPAAAGSESGESETPAEESRRAKSPDPWVVLAECKKEGYDPTPSQLKALARMLDPAERAEFVRECKEARGGDGERPRSAGRHQTERYAEERAAALRVHESRGGGGGKDGSVLRWED